jgi:hypothetical protein
MGVMGTLPVNAEYLVVAGGSGGEAFVWAAAETGGYQSGSTTLQTLSSYPVIVGGGTAGAGNRSTIPGQGGSSSVLGISSTGGGGEKFFMGF